MSHMETYAKFSIHPGKLSEFRSHVKAVVEVVRERDPGTLRYDWFICDDRMECVAMDTYIDEASMYAHQANVARHMGAVLKYSDMAVDFLGLPSGETREKLAQLRPGLFEFHRGLAPQAGALKFTTVENSADSGHIEMVTRFTIEEKHYEVFKNTAAELLEIVMGRNPGTSRCDWFYDEANCECIAMNLYADAPAMLAHIQNTREKYTELLQYSSAVNEVLGELPQQAAAMAEYCTPDVLPFFDGMKP